MLSVFWQRDVRMVSTESVSPTKGNLRSSVVCDWATMDVMSVCRSESFLENSQYTKLCGSSFRLTVPCPDA